MDVKNNHTKKNILLNEYGDSQNIYLSNLLSHKCSKC